MNIHPQLIIKNKTPEFVVLPYKEYKHLMDVVEDREDIRAIEDFHSGNQQTVPLKALQSISSGEHPVKVFRELAGLTQSELANKVGITRQYMCQIESSQRKGGVELYRKLAKVLDTDIDLLAS